MPILGRYGRIELRRQVPEPVILPASALDWPRKEWISALIEPVWPTDRMVLVYQSVAGLIDFIIGYAYHDESGKLYLHSQKTSALNNTKETRIHLESVDQYPMILAHYEGGDRVDYLRGLLGVYISERGASTGSGDPLWSKVKMLFPMDDPVGTKSVTNLGSVPMVLAPVDANYDYGCTDEFQLFGRNTFKTVNGPWNNATYSPENALAATEYKATMEYHVCFSDYAANAESQFYIGETADFAVRKNGIYFPSVSYPSFVPELNRYYHVAFVRDVDLFMIFVDGVKVAQSFQSPFNTTLLQTTNFVMQGQILFSSYRGHNGFIANARYTVDARYTKDFTPPSSPYPTSAAVMGLNSYYTAPTSIRAIEGALEDYDAIPATEEDEWKAQGKVTRWSLDIQIPEVQTGEVGNRYSTATNVSGQASGEIDALIEIDKSGEGYDSDTILRSTLLTERGSRFNCRFYINDPESPRGLTGRSIARANTLLYYETEITFTNAAISAEASGLLMLSADFVSDGTIVLHKE